MNQQAITIAIAIKYTIITSYIASWLYLFCLLEQYSVLIPGFLQHSYLRNCMVMPVLLD